MAKSALEKSHSYKLAQKFGKESFTIAEASKALKLNLATGTRRCYGLSHEGKLNNVGENDAGKTLYALSRQELDRQQAILAGKKPQKRASNGSSNGDNSLGLLIAIRESWGTTAGGQAAFNEFIARIALDDPVCHDRIEKKALERLASLVRNGK